VPASLTIDESLLHRMAREASVYSLVRPAALVMWAALSAALVVSLVNVGSQGADADALTAWLPPAVIALGAYAVWLTVANARRAVRAAMPPGSVVWANIGATGLQIGAARRTSEISFRTFQSVRVGRDTVLLKVRGAAVVTAVPRALFSDDDLATLRTSIS
jgi:hypothetical protein